jgi:hypothetical protein
MLGFYITNWDSYFPGRLRDLTSPQTTRTHRAPGPARDRRARGARPRHDQASALGVSINGNGRRLRTTCERRSGMGSTSPARKSAACGAKAPRWSGRGNAESSRRRRSCPCRRRSTACADLDSHAGFVRGLYGDYAESCDSMTMLSVQHRTRGANGTQHRGTHVPVA